MKRYCFLLVAAITGCQQPEALVAFPTTGFVYIEKTQNKIVTLAPASNVLVVAERINSCDRSKWLPSESSTQSIDIHLTRTGSDGHFQIPQLKASQGFCNVVLMTTGLVPHYKSLSGRVIAAGPSRVKIYSPVTENDAVLQLRGATLERTHELSNDLGFALGSANDNIRSTALAEIAPEIQQLSSQFPADWQRECTRFSVCDP
jgi:hypothetical protein